MVKGMEEGRYMLKFPEFVSTCICAGLGGTSELCLPVVVSAFIAPLVVSALARHGYEPASLYFLLCQGASDCRRPHETGSMSSGCWHGQVLPCIHER